jgi:hypothetical protein
MSEWGLGAMYDIHSAIVMSRRQCIGLEEPEFIIAAIRVDGLIERGVHYLLVVWAWLDWIQLWASRLRQPIARIHVANIGRCKM